MHERTDWLRWSWPMWRAARKSQRPRRTPWHPGLAPVLLTLVFAGQAAAKENETWMDDKALNDAFDGRIIAGIYDDGRRFEEEYRKGGRLVYWEGPRETTGNWSVVGSTFCTIYNRDPSGGCYRVTRRGENCFEFYFVARSVAQVRRKGEGKPGWTARAWRKDEPATCTETPIA